MSDKTLQEIERKRTEHDDEPTVQIRTPRPSKAPEGAGTTEPPKAPPVPKEP